MKILQILLLFLVGLAVSVLVLLLLEEYFLLNVEDPVLLYLSSGLSAVSVGLFINILDGRFACRFGNHFDLVRVTGGYIGLVVCILRFKSIVSFVLAFGLWFMFDRTLHGFTLGIVGGLVAFQYFTVCLEEGAVDFYTGDVPYWTFSLVFTTIIYFVTVGRHLNFRF